MRKEFRITLQSIVLQSYAEFMNSISVVSLIVYIQATVVYGNTFNDFIQIAL